MLPVFVSHQSYQDAFITRILDEYPDPFQIPKSIWTLMNQFYHLDLSQTFSIVIECYSAKGPLPRNPITLLRSYLLMIKTGETSVTRWVSTLRINPMYAIISGFPPGDLPGIGTFYDFFDRCWLSDSNNFHSHERVPRRKVPKGKKSGEKTPIDTTSVSETLFAFFERHPVKSSNPFGLIFTLYQQQFLNRSHQEGLIDLNHLSLAGDGTPIVTASRLRRTLLCDCNSKDRKRCNCKRHFSQPDTDIGWDSYRERYFSGYHLYMFVASDSDNDLPIFPLLQPASRHDLPSFIQSFFTMKAWLPEASIQRILLDSAHDAMPVYNFCDSQDISAFIDLNPRGLGKFRYKDSFTIGFDGIPVCQEGHKMKPDGHEPTKYRVKYRCPKFSRTKGCYCGNPCSDAAYGRKVNVLTKDNPRIFCIPSRDSKEWHDVYKQRTSVERSNKREKNDYKLEAGKHRSSKMWYCRLYAILMLQHLDAWKMSPITTFQKLFC